MQNVYSGYFVALMCPSRGPQRVTTDEAASSRLQMRTGSELERISREALPMLQNNEMIEKCKRDPRKGHSFQKDVGEGLQNCLSRLCQRDR